VPILQVPTVSVERVFSAISQVRIKLRNNMGDGLFKYCLVTFVDQALCLEVSKHDIVRAFMAMQRERVGTRHPVHGPPF
jgi:hypothetical protein